MHPLLFLSLRSTINGVKRAVTTPRRLIGFLAITIYYLSFIVRTTGPARPTAATLPLGDRLSLPGIDILEAVIFVIFAVLTLTMMLSVFSPRGGFRAADVDVLFATPVDPKAVLAMRMLREYLVSLFVPLFLIILTGRGAAAGYQFLFHGTGLNGPLAIRMVSIAWFLVSLAWVCLGFGFSMLVNRSDLQSDTNKRLINGVIYGAILSVIAYASLRLGTDPTFQTAVEVTQTPLVRIVFFSATAAASMVGGALEQNVGLVALGVVGLLALAGVGLAVAVRNVGTMYDQAAARGFKSDDAQRFQKTGDTYGLIAERAREGKVRAGRLTRWIGSWQLSGGPALVWKELLLQGRGSLWQYIIFGPMMLLLLVPILSRAGGSNSPALSGMVFVMLGMGVFIFAVGGSQSGFIELLRRIDFQKPLPFPPAVTVLWEVVGKAVPCVVSTTAAAIIAAIISRGLWQTSVASILVMPTFALSLISIVLIVTLLFPDMEDATQRGFRGMMIMLGSVIVALPGVLTIAAMLGLLKASPILAVLPAIAINVALTFGISFLAGSLYEQFNPSE